MKNIRLQNTCLATLGTLALCVISADAKPGQGNSQGKGKGNSAGEHAHKDKGNKANKGNKNKGHKHHKFEKFKDDERKTIINLFSESNRTNLPPGLAKNLRRGKPLPPGWQKKLSTGSILSEEWLGAFQPISYDLLPKTQRVPNTRLYRYDNRVVRIADATREILDVITLP